MSDPYTVTGSRPLTYLFPNLTVAEHPESSQSNNGPVAPTQNPSVSQTAADGPPHESAEQDADDEAADDTDDTRWALTSSALQ